MQAPPACFFSLFMGSPILNVGVDFRLAYYVSLAASVLLLFFLIYKYYQLYRERALMLEKIKERTQEITLQKNEIEAQRDQIAESYVNLALLSEIGQQLTSSLDLETLFERLYGSINDLVEASTFGFLIYNEANQELEFSFILQRYRRLSYISIPIKGNEKIPAVWCVLNKRPLLINNEDDAESAGLILNQVIGEKQQVSALIYYPLIVGKEILGAITVQSFKPDVYNERHLEIMKVLASYTAIGYKNAQAFSQLRESNQKLNESQRELASLSELTRSANSELDLQTPLNKFFQAVAPLIEFDGGMLLEINENRDQLFYSAIFGNIGPELKSLLMQLTVPLTDKSSIWTRSLNTANSIIIEDANNYNRFGQNDKDFIDQIKVQSLHVIPIYHMQQPLGCVTLLSLRKRLWINYKKISKIENYLDQISGAIHNANLFKKAIQTEKKIRRQNEFLERAYSEIEIKNREITDSLNYAKYLQDSILPLSETITNSFPEGFIFYKPRDIVSGDFYWYARKFHYQLIVVADCTGHGVPGAFMTVMGSIMLTSILNEGKLIEPRHILSELDRRIRNIFGRSPSDDNFVLNGMEMAICLIDTTRRIIQFSGANRPLVIIGQNRNETYQGDRISIGMGLITPDEKQFTQQVISYQPDDNLYLYTDGFRDQFGGPLNRKYSSKRFLELLVRISPYPMDQQLEMLEGELNIWRGDIRQLDDILVLGLKL